MKIVPNDPPNFEKIKKVLNPSDRAIFCYGDTIYGKAAQNLDPSYLVHECIHSRQQGDDPEAWWDRYLEDPTFRLFQEKEAYQAQYYFVTKTIKDPNQRALRLFHMSTDLASDQYKIGMTQEEARKAITSP